MSRLNSRMQGRRAIALTLMLFVALLLPASVTRARPAPDGFADLAAKLMPAVVNLSLIHISEPTRP